MSRRQQLLHQLFRMKRPGGGGFGRSTSADHAERMARETARLIFADIIGYCRKFWKDLGPGALVIRMTMNDATWADAEELGEQHDLAAAADDSDLAEAFGRTLAILDRLNPDDEVLICIADHVGFRSFVIPVDNPTAQIEAMLKEAYR